LTVNSSERSGLKFGSIVSPEPVATSLKPGYHGCGRFALGLGSGATTPSVPTRKTSFGVIKAPPGPPQPPGLGPPGLFGAPQVTGCSNPGVSIGTRIGLTPLIRPKMRAYPARTTVSGLRFHAIPMRGLSPPKNGS